MIHRSFFISLPLVMLALLSPLSPVLSSAAAQGIDVENRPIADIRVEGVNEVDARLVLNQVRSQKGQPLDQKTLARDIQNITRLGRFSTVKTKIEAMPDGSVILIFKVNELPVLSDVQVVGNKSFSDQELLPAALLQAGDPRDRYLINKAQENIRRVYRESGYFLANVEVDEKTLEETGILILQIREGPKVKIREVVFEGNKVFPNAQLKSKVRTKKHIFILEKGILNEQTLDLDVAQLRNFYEDQGYLDVRIGSRIDLADNQQDAKVVFLIDEGDQYTVGRLQIKGNTVFSDKQIQGAMILKRGDIYSANRLKSTNRALADLYGKVGRIATRIHIQRVFDPEKPLVHIVIDVRKESARVIVGPVLIRNNLLTQDRVIRRQIRGLEPGRVFDSTGIARSQRKIQRTGIIRQAKITILGDDDDAVRDVLVEVDEANTGSVSFGASVSSDLGVFGAIDLSQRNFDITDFPETWSELLTGRAFRGAGQSFSISLQPGDEFQRYSVSFREPYVFDSDYFFDFNAFFFTRDRENWTENRVGGSIGLGKRFGDIWSAGFRLRVEQVDVDDVEPDAVVDARAFEGTNMLDSFGFFMTRSTVNSRLFPTRGTRFEAGLTRTGLVSDDFEFWRVSAEWSVFLTIDEDFLERKTIVSLKSRIGYIFDDGSVDVKDDMGTTHTVPGAPLFERFYAGGHRTFRGFEHRGVGPRGIQIDTGKKNDDPVGGNFLFLLGAEYNFPIYDKYVRGVFFIDSGTVQEDFGLDEYRVSVGTGIRLSLPFLGQAPFAFDLAIPLLKQEDDETRLFSFDIALPF